MIGSPCLLTISGDLKAIRLNLASADLPSDAYGYVLSVLVVDPHGRFVQVCVFFFLYPWQPVADSPICAMARWVDMIS